MTATARRPAPSPATSGHPRPPGPDPAPFVPAVRPMRDDELPWAIHSWSQAWKDSPGHRNRTWSDYKAHHVQPIRDALCRPDSRRLAVDGPIPGRAIGWMCWCRWPSIDTVHWVYVSKGYRRHGAMTALLAHAALRPSVVYTFQAAVMTHLPRWTDGSAGRNDHWIADLLRARGHTVSLERFEEWSR